MSRNFQSRLVGAVALTIAILGLSQWSSINGLSRNTPRLATIIDEPTNLQRQVCYGAGWYLLNCQTNRHRFVKGRMLPDLPRANSPLTLQIELASQKKEVPIRLQCRFRSLDPFRSEELGRWSAWQNMKRVTVENDRLTGTSHSNRASDTDGPNAAGPITRFQTEVTLPARGHMIEFRVSLKNGKETGSRETMSGWPFWVSQH